MTPSSKLDAILSLGDTQRFVRDLRPDELYFLSMAIGMEDAYALLPYATTEQRRAIADLDTWSGGTYLPERFDRLLELASHVSSDLAVAMVKETDTEARRRTSTSVSAYRWSTTSWTTRATTRS